MAAGDYNGPTSARLADRLSGALNVPRDHLRAFVTQDGLGPMNSFMRAVAGPGSVVGLQLGNGTWRVVSVPESPFVDTVAARLMWMLGLGVLAGSLVSATLGYIVLSSTHRRRLKKG